MNLGKVTLGQLYYLARYSEYRTAALEEFTRRMNQQ